MTTTIRAVPPGSVLVHLGPYKTSTTALQAALFEAREVLPAHGVHYPGSWRRAMHQGWALLGWAPPGRYAPEPSVWDEFAAGVLAAIDSAPGSRACVSTEDFSLADRDQAARVVGDLGGPERVHVLLAVRRLDRLLPSAWQEWIKTGEVPDFDSWLRDVLDPQSDSPAHRIFWAAEDTARVARRWLGVLPADHVHVVVLDDTQRDVLVRACERLLDLPEGLLAPPSAINASLTANATELVRRVNEAFKENGWSDFHSYQLVYRGAIERLMETPSASADTKVPPPPAWAAAEIERRIAEQEAGLESLGVDVIGDLAALRLPEGRLIGQDVEAAPDAISIEQASAALEGVIFSARRLLRNRREEWRERLRVAEAARKEAERAARKAVRQAERRAARQAAQQAAAGPLLRDASGRELLRALARRARQRVQR